MIRLVATLALILGGCAASHPHVAVNSLDSMVGHRIELRGIIGSGKIADFVSYQEQQIYFQGPNKTDTGSIPTGTRVIARGILQHYVSPKVTPGISAVQAPPEDYYSIISAQVKVEP